MKLISLTESCGVLLGRFASTGAFVCRLFRRFIIPYVLKKRCPPPRNLAKLAEISKDFHVEPIPFSAVHKYGLEPKESYHGWLALQNKAMHAANINVRRLPELTRGFDPAEKLGIQHLSEHTHAYLWLGATAGGIHPDLQDNILIQLNTEAEVIVFPQACYPLVQGIPNRANLMEWLPEGQPPNKSKAPFFHIHVKPGEGVVIPSLSLHQVISRNSHRIGINYFFEPKFDKMMWPQAPGNKFVRARRHDRAMRFLWVRTAKTLWDTHKIALFMHTGKMEVI